MSSNEQLEIEFRFPVLSLYFIKKLNVEIQMIFELNDSEFVPSFKWVFMVDKKDCSSKQLLELNRRMDQ